MGFRIRMDLSLVYITWDLEAPALQLFTPFTYSTAGPSVQLDGEASDKGGPPKVRWVSETTGDSGGVLFDGTHWTAWIPLGAGDNVIRVTATDWVGHSTTSSITVRKPAWLP